MNWKTGRIVPVNEHENAIRDSDTIKLLSVPRSVVSEFARYARGANKNKFVRWLMKRAPLMCIFKEGIKVTFEYASKSDTVPHAAVLLWVEECGTPNLSLRVVNLQTSRRIAESVDEFMKREPGKS